MQDDYGNQQDVRESDYFHLSVHKKGLAERSHMASNGFADTRLRRKYP